MKKKVLIAGSGPVAARIASVLAAGMIIDPVVLHPKTKGQSIAIDESVPTQSLDLDDLSSLDRALVGAFALVNVSAGQDYAIADLCARHGVHYIDLGQGRGLAQLEARARDSGASLISGAALASVAGALVDFLRDDFERISEVHLSYAVGHGVIDRAEGLTPFLRIAGCTFPVIEEGQWRDASGWSRSERVRFPCPVGARRAFLCDSPELVLFPAHYGVTTVTYRASLPLRVYNYGLLLLAWAKRRSILSDLTRFGRMLAWLGRRFGGSGTQRSALGARVVGQRDGEARERQAFLIASPAAWLALQAAPALSLLHGWADGRRKAQPGARPCLGLIGIDDLKQQLAGEEIVLVLS